MKAYFYCRVAHDDSFSLERQAEELRRYAEQAGYTIVGAAAEHGSGMTLDRPALQEVMEAVLAGKVDVVLCLRERVSSDISGVSPFSRAGLGHDKALHRFADRAQGQAAVCAGTDDDRQLQLFTIFYIKSRVSITGYSDPIRTLCMVRVTERYFGDMDI